MALVKVDQTPAPVTVHLNRGDDMTPIVATFRNLNLSTAAGYTWTSRIFAAGVVSKTLTVTAVVSGSDTVVTASGLTDAESTALATSNLTWDLLTTSPKKRTYLEGPVICD